MGCNIKVELHQPDYLEVVTPAGFSVVLQISSGGDELLISGVNDAGNVAGNPAFYLKRPNELGVVFNRGAGPSATGDPFLLDGDDKITEIS